MMASHKVSNLLSSTPLSLPFHPLRMRFPNAVFAMMPNKSGIDDKRVVTFRVPLNYAKPQIKNYLQQIYGVRVLKVSTIIQHSDRSKMNLQTRRLKHAKDFKKAMVTLDEPFTYPNVVEQAEITSEALKTVGKY